MSNTSNSMNHQHAPHPPREFDLKALLHPAGAFAHPRDVVHDPDLTLYEKRAILASWASDACAVESAPALRMAQPGSDPVTFDDVMDALRSLDEEFPPPVRQERRYRRVLAERIPGVFGRKTARSKGFRAHPRNTAGGEDDCSANW